MANLHALILCFAGVLIPSIVQLSHGTKSELSGWIQGWMNATRDKLSLLCLKANMMVLLISWFSGCLIDWLGK